MPAVGRRPGDQLQAARTSTPACGEFAPQGVNVWWETVREPNFDRAIGLLAERGRMVLMAGRDARPLFPVGPFYVKQCTLHGFVMFKATPEEQRAAADDINGWLVGGQAEAAHRPPLPLAEAAAGPSAARGEHDPQGGNAGGQDRAQAVI